MTEDCTEQLHAEYGGACHYCCERCNYETHRCHFCGTDLYHNSYEKSNKDGTFTGRHYLSDCRPDLIEDGTFPDSPVV